MNYTDKYTGFLNSIRHSAPEFAIGGEDMKISAACRAENGTAPDKLTVFVQDGNSRPLLPTEVREIGDVAYVLYAGTVPAAELQGKSVTYAVGTPADAGTAPAQRVELLSPEALPAQPPLVLSEIYARPKGRGVGAYLEVMNPSAEPVDLYGYEFLIYDNQGAPEGKPTCRLPMADAPATELLQPGEYAAIWGITVKHTDKKGREWCTPADFFEDFEEEFTNRNLHITESACRVIPVHYYTTDENGVKTPLPGVADIPERHHHSFLCIVPRGADADKAVYSVEYSAVYGSWDTPVKRSSYWTTDVRNPSRGVNICHYAPATPGFAGIGQDKPDVRAALPVILPVSPDCAVYIGDGDCDVRFAAVATEVGRKVTDAHILVGEGDACMRLEAEYRDDGLFHARIPAEYVRKQTKLAYRVFASDGTRTVSTGKEALVIAVYDNAGPFVTSMLPTEGYAYDGTSACEIRAEWEDISGTDLGASLLKIDGKNVTGETSWTQTGLRYTGELTSGKHVLFLVLADSLGNITEKRVRFSVSDMQELRIYRGQVHCHTADSDGTGYPCDAYRYAREEGGADFFAVTDHSHYIDDRKYAELIRTADLFDEPGKFAALYGWEMTWNAGCGYWGHINVLNTRDFVQNIDTTNEPQLFEWLKKRPEGLGMFNHPGYRWGNFDEYAHKTEDADKAMCLAEIRTAYYDFEYAHMLSRGWHASPVSNEDNHAADWTTATNSDGYVLAPALTRQNVLDAFRANRTYTCSDKTMQIYYKVNGAWLGSHLNNPDKLRFDIRITTENPAGIGVVDIVGEDGIIVLTKNARGLRELTWKPVLPPDFDYYYVRITGPDQYCVTSPVWVDNRGEVQITGMQYQASMEAPDTATVTVSLRNPTENTMHDVRVHFYLSSQSGLKLTEAEPFHTVCCGRVKAGTGLKVSAQLPELPGLRRATAIATVGTGKGKRSATSGVMMCPVRITAVLPDSTALEKDGTAVKNPFPYVTLCNASPAEISLKGARLCAWTKLGKDPQPERVLTFPELSVAPRSALTVWARPAGSTLTAADFNSRYGTSLAEGENLYVTDVPLFDASTDGRRLDLRLGDDIVSRAHWNYGLEYIGNSQKDAEHRYVYRPNMTGTVTSTHLSKPCPGFVDEEQFGTQKSVTPNAKDKRRLAGAIKKDERTEFRRQNAVLTKKEGVATAAGAAALGAGIAGGIAVLLKKLKK